MFGVGPVEALLILLVIAVVFGPGALVLWFVVSRLGGNAPTGEATAGDRALAIARERYAAGEITREQYEEIARTLAGSEASHTAESRPAQPEGQGTVAPSDSESSPSDDIAQTHSKLSE